MMRELMKTTKAAEAMRLMGPPLAARGEQEPAPLLTVQDTCSFVTQEEMADPSVPKAPPAEALPTDVLSSGNVVGAVAAEAKAGAPEATAVPPVPVPHVPTKAQQMVGDRGCPYSDEGS